MSFGVRAAIWAVMDTAHPTSARIISGLFTKFKTKLEILRAVVPHKGQRLLLLELATTHDCC